jgi:hypothetical protein
MTRFSANIKKEGIALPVRVHIYYNIIEKIREQGDFLVNGRMIPGVRNYYFNSGLWLTWKLPRSKKQLLDAIQKWKWRMPGIEYDHSKMDIESRHQDHFDDFDINNKRIARCEKFHGREATIVTEIQSKSGPVEIRVFFDDGREKAINVHSRTSVLRDMERLLV